MAVSFDRGGVRNVNSISPSSVPTSIRASSYSPSLDINYAILFCRLPPKGEKKQNTFFFFFEYLAAVIIVPSECILGDRKLRCDRSTHSILYYR